MRNKQIIPGLLLVTFLSLMVEPLATAAEPSLPSQPREMKAMGAELAKGLPRPSPSARLDQRTLPSIFAERGGSDPGGGDDQGLEVSGAAYEALRFLSGTSVAFRLDLQDLNDLTGTALILMTDDELVVHIGDLDQAAAAENNPDEGWIRVNRARWNSIQSPHLREALALHEILSLRHLERTGYYPISGRYLSLFNLTTDQLKSLMGTTPPLSEVRSGNPPDGPRGNHPPDGPSGGHPPDGPRGGHPPG